MNDTQDHANSPPCDKIYFSKPHANITLYNTFTITLTFLTFFISVCLPLQLSFATHEKVTKMSYGGGYGSSRGGGYGGASGGYSNGYDDYRSGGGYAGARDYSTTYSHGYDYPGLDVEV